LSIDFRYGHGYEIIKVAANNQGTLIATSCKASKADHAVVRLWSTKTWREVCPPLAFHSLTVTSLTFSHDGKYLLTAGRDRGWALFEMEGYTLAASMSKAHARIIWDTSFTPDDKFFATASRDKILKVWSCENFKLMSPLTFASSVTAVDIKEHDGAFLFAVGLESGMVVAVTIGKDGAETSRLYLAAGDTHGMAVKCVQWRPNSMEGILATCSEDTSVRLYTMNHFTETA
jgi:elongator complex protein 2